jgi:glycosyltransferase involved in cell wall biosynthesis
MVVFEGYRPEDKKRMAPRISLLLPTRERPHLVRRFFQSVAEKTARLNDVEVILYIDEDDTASRDLDDDHFAVDRIIGPRTTMGAYLNACLARSRGDVIVLVNDDMMIRTESWDRLLLDFHRSVEDGIYLAYANDLFRRLKVCTFPILSRKTCEALADPFPRSYKGAFIDYHLFDIFKRLNKMGHCRTHYFKDLIFQHLHHRTGKTPLDATYRHRGRFEDDATFLTLTVARQLEARRLWASLKGLPVPNVQENAPKDDLETSALRALLRCFRMFFLDMHLPFVWRSYLFVWFYGRCLASQGRLPFMGV